MHNALLVTWLLAHAAPVPAPPAAPTPPARKTVLVMPLKPQGVDAAAANQAAALIIHPFSERDDYSVMTMADVQKMAGLAAVKEMLGCTGSNECAAQYSKALNADLVVLGTLGRVGTHMTVGLSLVDVKTSRN